MRLLFTSNDPGSAQQNNAVANLLNLHNAYDTACITSKVSSKFYSSLFKEKLYLDHDKRHHTKKIKNYINYFKPDFIFLGISPSKKSIDFIASEIAIDLNIRTASIQDYYGWTGSFNEEVKPDYFFVFDEYAKKLTVDSSICSSQKVIVTGSPKHYSYANHLKSWEKQVKTIEIANSELIFFLQPLFIEGIKSNLINFCKSLKKINSGYKLNIKPHPLDKKSEDLRSISNDFQLNIIDDKYSIEMFFLYFSNIINCFSTVAYDYYYITNFLINIKNSRLINLLIGEDIFKSIKKLNFDIRMTPQYKIGVNIKTKKSLDEKLRLIFNLSNSPNLNYKSKNLTPGNNPVDKIENILKGV